LDWSAFDDLLDENEIWQICLSSSQKADEDFF
jgi:hypothetical protein